MSGSNKRETIEPQRLLKNPKI